MQIKCPCCGNTCEIESEPIVGQHMVCPFCSGKFPYADDGKRNEDLHRGDALEEYLDEKIVIKCPECGTEYEIDNDAIGSTCQCSVCNRDFIARDDSSVEIGDAQEKDGIAGTEEPSVETEDFCSEQDSKTLSKKERHKVFSKERIDALCLKAKELSATKTNQIVRLWNSGVKGKVFLCAVAVIVLWLSSFFLMCGGEPKAGDVKTIKLPGGATMDLVYCPPGTFVMGSPASEEGHREDETQHQVTLTRGFWIGKYEVTQEQWESVMGSNPSYNKGSDLPVDNVSWADCRNFCTKARSDLRLPTEAEWEYACRAGTAGKYAGTGEIGEMGWFARNGESTTHAVGRKRPNAWGLFDMHGNVYEWCLDWYGDYQCGITTNPTGSTSGTYRVNRGGCASSEVRYCRSADRSSRHPIGGGNRQGFRVVCPTDSAVGEKSVKGGQESDREISRDTTEESRSDKSSSGFGGSRRLLKEHIAKNNNCRICAITQGGGNVVVCGKNNWASIGCSQLITEELQKVTDEGKLIVDVTLTEYGRFIAIYGDGTASWKRIPSEMEKFLRAYHDRFEDVLSVALNDDGAWILVTSDHFACSGAKLKSWIDEGQRQYGRLRAAALTADAAVAVFEDGFCFLGDVPSDLKDALKEAKFGVRNIKIAGSAWFFAVEDGNSYQGNL